MKRSSKILLLIVMIAISLSVFSLFAFAEDGEDTKNPIVDTYINGDDHLIIVLEDGTEYDLGENVPVDDKEVSGIDISINYPRFVNSLQYMWKGMLCIFIVIGAIIVVIYALNKVVNYAVDSIENKKKASTDKSAND